MLDDMGSGGVANRKMQDIDFEIDRLKASIYVPWILEQIPRLLSTLDREPFSVSYGSFDREHWGWKFRDFPITMAQMAAYPLALLWRLPFPDNPYFNNPEVLRWITGALQNTCTRQHRNGAFDSVGPYTQDHGVTLAMVFNLTEVRRLLEGHLSPQLQERIVDVVARGCEFARHSSEDYAFISNHHALFALACRNAHELLGDARLARDAAAILTRIINAQSKEGWYREYQGADPGYESLDIFYLATYWKRFGDTRLLESLRSSIQFVAHCVHPDGSIGGVYGSRCTSLYFPGGFELLAGEIPLAASIARFMRSRLHAGNVLTPNAADPHNLPVLAYTYLNACQSIAAPKDVQPLPFETLKGIHSFPEAGMVIAAHPRYYAVISAAKGGVCRVFDKQHGSVTYEDAGYILCARGARFTSQSTALTGVLQEVRQNEIEMTTCMAEIRQTVPTPMNYMLLRLLNLTVFRSLRFGAWVRRKIIAHLILHRRPGPARLTRRMRFSATEIHVQDRVELMTRVQVERIELMRQFTSIHMGSAKYFHSAELQRTLLPVADTMLSELKRDVRADYNWCLRFTSDGGSQVIHGSMDENPSRTAVSNSIPRSSARVGSARANP